jgi:hypothetical protein
MATPVNMKVYANDDDALIIWNVPAAIPDCLGFAIQRRTYNPADPAMKTIAHEDVLPNRIGFVDDPNAAPGSTALSTVWPFQRFWWTDHAAAQGDILSYRVIPMVGTHRHRPGIQVRQLRALSWGGSDVRRTSSGERRGTPPGRLRRCGP